MALTRSEQMSRIRSLDTRPERLLRSAIWRAGLRFRVNLRSEFGRPDITFTAARVVIFVDGCFWHGCPDHYLRPRTREKYWADKLSANVHRDLTQTARLEAAGWRVYRVWEHEIFETLDAVVSRVAAVLTRRLRKSKSWRVMRVEPIAGADNLERWHLCSLSNIEDKKAVVRYRTARMWSRARAGAS